MKFSSFSSPDIRVHQPSRSLLLLPHERNTEITALSKDTPTTNTHKKGPKHCATAKGSATDEVLLGRQSLTFGIDSGDALGGADVPDADGFVPGCCDKEVRVAGVPAELVHAVPMAPVVVLLHLEREDNQRQDEPGSAPLLSQDAAPCYRMGREPRPEPPKAGGLPQPIKTRRR